MTLCQVYNPVPFYCHKGIKDGQPKHLCAGYAILIGTEAFEAENSQARPE